MELVGSRGLPCVTVEDIAAAADVSARTFFNYFASKEDAISGLDPDALSELVSLLAGRPGTESPPVALRAALLQSLSGFEAHPSELLARLELIRSDPHLLAHFASAWAEAERQLVAALAGRAGCRAADEPYLSLVVATTMTASRVAMLSWCERGGDGSLHEEVERHLDVLAAGLSERGQAGRGEGGGSRVHEVDRASEGAGGVGESPSRADARASCADATAPQRSKRKGA